RRYPHLLRVDRFGRHAALCRRERLQLLRGFAPADPAADSGTDRRRGHADLPQSLRPRPEARTEEHTMKLSRYDLIAGAMMLATSVPLMWIVVQITLDFLGYPTTDR